MLCALVSPTGRFHLLVYFTHLQISPACRFHPLADFTHFRFHPFHLPWRTIQFWRICSFHLRNIPHSKNKRWKMERRWSCDAFQGPTARAHSHAEWTRETVSPARVAVYKHGSMFASVRAWTVFYITFGEPDHAERRGSSSAMRRICHACKVYVSPVQCTCTYSLHWPAGCVRFLCRALSCILCWCVGQCMHPLLILIATISTSDRYLMSFWSLPCQPLIATLWPLPYEPLITTFSTSDRYLINI